MSKAAICARPVSTLLPTSISRTAYRSRLRTKSLPPQDAMSMPKPNPTRIEDRCIWLREAIAVDEVDAPPLMGSHKAEICIVGGGFAGLWTSIEIKKRDPSCDVAIIEADICG